MKSMKGTFMAVSLLLCAALFGQELEFTSILEQPVLESGETQRTYIKVGIKGYETDGSIDRPPVNVAIVLDRSGSMSGDKIRQAKEAAKYAVDLLGPQDILSIITYESTVDVLMPATRVADKNRVKSLIDEIQIAGSTALFAGVSKGAEELRKFLDRDRVNRIILLSDGIANVGPDSPGALGDLGSALRKQGISVSTTGLGLGYNEDLMFRLAQKSDGNHAFVENAKDLVRIFDYEFRDVMSVVAQDVRIKMKLLNGVKPIRVLNRDAEIFEDEVSVIINQVYSSQEKYFLLEVEVPAGADQDVIEVAAVDVSYRNLKTQREENLSDSLGVTYTDNSTVAFDSREKEVAEAVVLQVATENADRAVALRDEGKLEEAQGVLEANALFLNQSATELGSNKLLEYADDNEEFAEEIIEGDWVEQRKMMRDSSFENTTQQTY
jgi:Ca-activated chloride channel family protein